MKRITDALIDEGQAASIWLDQKNPGISTFEKYVSDGRTKYSNLI